MMVLLSGCARTPGRNLVAKAPQSVNWDQPGGYKNGPWQLGYSAKDKPRWLRWGHLTYKGFYLKMENGRINDRIVTPWGVLYWAGTWRHPWGYQGWEPKRTEGRRGGRLVTPGLILASEVLRTPYGVWRERPEDRIQVIIEDLPVPNPPLQPNGMLAWEPLKALEKMLARIPSLAAREERAQQARRLAGAPNASKVIEVRGQWIVLVDDGHPAADGRFRITVIDCDSRKVLKTLGMDGSRGAMPIPTR